MYKRVSARILPAHVYLSLDMKSKSQRAKPHAVESARANAPKGVGEELDNGAVKVKWDVKYRPLQHDILVLANVAVSDDADVLLQIWLRDEETGVWIPELQPRSVSVIEFAPSQKVKQALTGLFDGKWRKGDAGKKYLAYLGGYVLRSGTRLKFLFEKKFTYPKP